MGVMLRANGETALYVHYEWPRHQKAELISRRNQLMGIEEEWGNAGSFLLVYGSGVGGVGR